MRNIQPESGADLPGSGTVEPVAVVGASCRLPGAARPEDFWSLLRDGVETVGAPPEGRRASAAATAAGVPERAGYLDRVDAFDERFFRISPREAQAMDPQQRLLLELGWEALEDARIAPDAVRHGAVGVFVGAILDDYAALHARRGADAFGPYAFTGLARGLLANRLSYVLGLRGPSMTVDTGQSSSLVAVHLACASLQRGESSMALVGGVHLNLDPEGAVRAARFGALSPNGRCRVFDAGADGFARGEGGALVVLKPLRTALRDGDRIHCVVLGSAMNNDGGGEGLTVPDPEAQRDVIRAACARAGVCPEDVQYVELHGTGTARGDVIEAAGLGAALGGGARGSRGALRVGSAKTNVGHLEGAAGITGFLKTVLSLTHRELPASLNFEVPNPAIAFDKLGLRVQAETGPWPSADAPLLAGVSAFGIGGTNCHVVLGDAPDRMYGLLRPDAEDRAEEASTPAAALAWPVSGRGAAGLRAQAKRLIRFLDERPGLRARDVAFSLATTRAALDQRAAVVGRDLADLRRGLESLAADRPAAGLSRGAAAEGRTAFLFTGQGSQRFRMGFELYHAYPQFALAFDEVCFQAGQLLDRALADIVFEHDAGLVDQTAYTQIALFALEVALFRLLESWGVAADFVAGHSIGELAAAYVAGVWSLEDACRLVVARGQLMQELPAGGAMLAVQATEDEVAAALAGLESQVSIAAVNGPTALVVSGVAEAVDALAERWRAEGRKIKKLTVSHAFHSPLMEPMLDEFRVIAESLTYNAPRIPVVSNLTGRLAQAGELCDPEYWVRHVREAVRFADGVSTLHAEGVRTFLELGPDAVLSALVPDGATALPVLRSDQPEDQSLMEALGGAFARGVAIDWTAVHAGFDARRVDLPTYAFQRRRHWFEDSPSTVAEPATAQPAAEPAATAVVEHSDAPAESIDSAEPSGFAAELAAASPEEAGRRALALVLDHAAALLGHQTAADVEPDLSFKDLGFNSLLVVQLRNALNEAAGLNLPSTVTFDHPTPLALADHIRTALAGPSTAAESEGTRAPIADSEPIAIVGIGCRFPGGITTPEGLWDLVAAERATVVEFPADRGWDLDGLFAADPAAAGTSYTRYGNFVDGISGFDNAFFGISPREAQAMDPQQRLLLETSWEALERAGLVPAALRGSRTGVFVGATDSQYSPRLHEAGDGTDGYRLTGSSISVASGRVAYLLGLEGQALTVDTACSSSLVALHLAVQALRRGECDLALAGGAALMPTPGMFVELSRQQALAPDGRCKAFASTADGTGWGEAVAMLAVERLSDAQRLGHPILAVVRGSAVNQDGASNGLTAPNGASQQQVIRQALADARLAPDQVDAVEAHGTGTKLGDPIEAHALLATYGAARSADQPLLLGSLKSNIGHTQAAAGVSGVIKMVLALRNSTLPRTLHIDEPTPHVDWSSGTVELLTAARAWPETGRPRRAAVSSFGISGTNAHLILEQAPETTLAGHEESAAPDTPAAAPRTFEGLPIVPWIASTRGESALTAQVGRLLGLATEPGVNAELDIASVSAALLRTRTLFEDRAIALGADRDELLAALDALSSGAEHPGAVRGTVRSRGERPVFVFPGQGTQWIGMATELMAVSPVFRASIEQVEAALAPLVDWSLTEVLLGDGSAFDGVRVLQPVLFAVMVSLAALWRSLGVEPSAVVGHSQGEIAAAYVAGILSLEDAVRVSVLRAHVMYQIAEVGSMVSLFASEERAQQLIDRIGGRLYIAAVNGPATVAISGEWSKLDRLMELCEAEGVRARRIAAAYPSHSPEVEVLEAEVVETLASVVPRQGQVPMLSTATGAWMSGPEVDAAYWYANLRWPVRYADAVKTLTGNGHRIFLEISAHPVLGPATQDTIEAIGVDAIALGTLRRNEGGPARFLRSAAEAFVQGVDVDWARLLPADTLTPAALARVALPTYAFHHQDFWLRGVETTDAAGLGLVDPDHPLLSAAVPLAGGHGLVLTGRLSTRTQPWLVDHAAAGTVLLPGTAFVEFLLHAAGLVGADRLDEVALEAPLVLPEGASVTVQVRVGAPEADGRRPAEVYSSREDATADPLADGVWTRHVAGSIGAADRAGAGSDALSRGGVGVLAEWPPAGAEALDVEAVYAGLGERGYEYGPQFRGLRAAWRRDGEVFAEVELAEEQRAAAAAYGLHPALLDAALHAALIAAEGASGAETSGAPGPLLLPFVFDDVELEAAGAASLRVRVTTDGADRVTLLLADAAGDRVAWIGSLTLRPVAPGALAASDRGRAMYRVDWTPAALPERAPAVDDRWILLGEDRLGIGSALTNVESHADFESFAQSLGTAAATENTTIAYTLPVAATDDAEIHSVPQATRSATYRALDLIRSWLTDERCAASRLLIITSGGVATSATAPGSDLAAAAVWGLLRSAQAENPNRIVLLDVEGKAPSAATLAAVLGSGEPRVALRGAGPLVPRLARCDAAPAAEQDVLNHSALDPAGTVLVTGGTGSLGGLVAQRLVERHGARRLLLVSRSGADAPGAELLRARLEALGAEVAIESCDVADRDRLAALLDRIPAEHPLTAVFHTAGVLADALIPSLTHERIDTVLRPKADAAWTLHELTGAAQLSHFVLFSSVMGVLGGPGQGNYAAANSFLDALAAHRRGAGLVATSLAWGPWAQTDGMTRDLGAADVERLARSGLPLLDEQEGLELFDAALARPEALLVPARLDLAALRARAAAGTDDALLRGLVRAPARRSAASAGTTTQSSPAEQLAGLPRAERQRVLTALVREQVAGVLGHASADGIGTERAFNELGFDSLTAVELRNRLGAATGLRLPVTVVFDHPKVGAMIRYLVEATGPQDTADEPVGTAAQTFDPDGVPDALIADLDLDQASDEELFELLDSDFGRS